MKQLFLLASALIALCSANAQLLQQPKTYSNKFYRAMSPNGKFVVSGDEYMGTISVLNLQTNAVSTYKPQNEEIEFYSVGCGANPVSDTGIVLFSGTENGTASYIENGTIKELPLPAGVSSALCNAITPDGSRIAGSIGISTTQDAKDVMQHPVIWNRQTDGTYSMPIELPYPTKDFTGRLPQYVLADGISADGKKIACNVIDYFGELPQPMFLQEDASGNWTYTMLANEYINPDNIVFPEYPGESPYPGNYMTPAEADAYNAAVRAVETLTQPSPKDFMTPENKAIYEELTSGYGNPVNFRDYMTDEEYAAYLAALDVYYASLYPKPEDYMYPDHREAYLKAMSEWNALYDAFEATLKQVQAKATTFEMNELMISPNGKYYTIAGSSTVNGQQSTVMQVYVFDLETGKSYVKGIDGVSVLAPRYITDDGRILASSFATRSDKTSNTYVAAGINSPFIPLQVIASEQDATLDAFMQKNMLHSMWVWDDDIEEDVQVNKWITGVGCCDANMETVFTWSTTDAWGSTSSNTIYSYSYGMPTPFLKDIADAISLPTTKSVLPTVKLTTDGTLSVKGNATEVSIYDLSGRLLFGTKAPNASTKTGLSHGTYIVKTTVGGKTTVTKVAL